MSSQKFAVTAQPTAIDMYYAMDQKHTHVQGVCTSCELESSSPCHKRCHGARMSQFLLPILITFLGLVALLGLSFYIHPFGLVDGSGLFTRAVEDSPNGNGSAFTDNKLYLIVIFVGLVVVVILAICLSAWCCRGAFQNPLCCPCYLCACCGGLACLECIGCGLCAEGAEQL